MAVRKSPDQNYVGGESDVRDENGKPVKPMITTPSLNADWFKSMMEDPQYQMSVDQVQNAVRKANNGEPLGVRQSRVIAAMLDHITGERTAEAELNYAREQLRLSCIHLFTW